MSLLVLSNGAGEDAIAASIVAHLKRPLVAFPLIGRGAAYPEALPRWGDLDSPPSQGLSNQSWRLWLHDLRSGLVGRLLSQLRLLRTRRNQIQATLAVGDLVPCALAALAGLQPLYFVGTAKSVYHHAYSWPERWLLKRWVKALAVRDQPTADFLRRHGLPAHYLGNPMMDSTVPQGRNLELGAMDTLVIFPGSRADAPRVLPILLQYWLDLQAHHGCQAAVAVAEGLDPTQLVSPGWTLHEGRLVGPSGPPVHLIQGGLGDLLASSQVALGVAGTAHEQAVGAGVPVVAPHSQSRLGWYRGRQKGLLGDALWVVPDRSEAVVAALRELFENPRERQRRAQIGRERMGQPGGARAIAAWLESQLP